MRAGRHERDWGLLPFNVNIGRVLGRRVLVDLGELLRRDTGIGDATDDIAGVRIARVTTGSSEAVTHQTEFAMLVVLRGEVTFATDEDTGERLRESSSVAIPSGVAYRLVDATADCELLDVTLPANV